MTASEWLKKRLIGRCKQANGWQTAGFTLLELLIAMLISSIVLSGLLFLVTEMLKIERRETAVDNVQQDMKRALQYIASDVSEAVYVYVPIPQLDGSGNPIPQSGVWPQAIESIQTVFQNGNTNNLVLAFWRPDFIEDESGLPPESACGYGQLASELSDSERDCQNLRQRRAYYTLVAYELVPDNATNDIWEGQARLVRHELPQYTDPASLTPGYEGDGPIDTDPSDGITTFDNWQPGGVNLAAVTQSAVLVDFVADPTQGEGGACRTVSNQVIRTPVVQDTSKSFFTCIRISDAALTDNQNLEIFLQGDPNLTGGQQSALGTGVVSRNSLLPVLRTGVFVQGIIGYDPG